MAIRYGISGFLFISVLVVFSCRSKPSHTDTAKPDSTAHTARQVSDSLLAGSFSGQASLRFDSACLDTFFIRHPALSPYAPDLRQFYRARNNAFAWYDVNGQTEQAGNLYNRIRNLPDEGIHIQDPYIKELDTLINNADLQDRTPPVQSELLLTTMYFYFAEKAWSGLQESKTRQIEWFVPRKKISYAQWLQTWLFSPDSAALVKEPVYRQYLLLKGFLHKYVRMMQQENWKPLSMVKKSYRQGDTAPLIKDIKIRLLALGDLPNADTSLVADSSLEQGIRQFQRRMGLKQDGRINSPLLSALNLPLQKRINQILVNMERSRWLPDTVQGNYLAINIPEFKLHMYQDDSLLWDMNVVVGQSVHKTVIFSGTLKNVVFSPYWNVPAGILKREVLPGIQKNKNYLALHHMERYGNSVRQKPGPWNSLGGVKFLFPNSYDIYLHDTPAKTLFGETDRAFSHGCIRLAEPLKLASFILRNDSGWNKEKIVRAMHTGKERWVPVREPFRVFIVYFTAWVDRQGHLNFRKDIYDRDKRLEEMLIP